MARTKRIKKQPAAKAPDGSIQPGFTQEQLDKAIETQKKEDESYYQTQRDRKIGETTADELFKRALDKFSQNPSSFSPEQISALKKAGMSLGYGKQETPKIPQEPSSISKFPETGAANPGFQDPMQKRRNGSPRDQQSQGGVNSLLGFLRL